MKKIVWSLLLLLWCGSAHFSAQADTATDNLLAAVVKQCRADKWDKTMALVAVDTAGARYIYQVDSGALVKTLPSSRPGGGLFGDWAEMSVVPWNAKMRPAAQGAGWLMHRVGGVWQLTAIDEGVGYSKEALHKGQVPPEVIVKLKLQTAE